MIIKDGKAIVIGSIKIKQKDSTGAGDAFVGAVLSQLSKIDNKNDVSFDNWKKIIEFANKVGAITCTNYGAITSIATIIGVKREGKLYLSPGPYLAIKNGDIIVYVGESEVIENVNNYITSQVK